MSDLIERLRNKGWNEQDITHAMEIIEQAKLQKPSKLRLLDSIIYWIVMFVALIGNFIISIILIPFMLAMEGISLIFIISIIGFAFGAFFDLIISDLKNLQNKQMIIAGVFLPILALINVSLMTEFANYLQKTSGILTAQHNPVVISIVYVIAFMLPYVIKGIITIMQKKNVSAEAQKF